MNRRALIAASTMGLMATQAKANSQNGEETTEALQLTTTWDKVFLADPFVKHQKIQFQNRYGVTLVADLYQPKDQKGRLPAIAVSGPFGAVKEQSSGLYAQRLARAGFVTLAFDPSFTVESGGFPRHIASPDLCTEDFSAAVDFLVTHDAVDADRVGILGICGWGGFALNAAAIDTRIKATVTSTMYDMSRVTANGYDDRADNPVTRHVLRETLNAQRTKDFVSGGYARTVMNPEPETDAPQFMKDYFDYYKRPRGFHPRSINSGLGWNVTMSLPFLNTRLLVYADEIETPVLMVHGEKAHSRYFSETAFKKLKGENKQLMIVPDANHTDLYDSEKILFEKIIDFCRQSLA